MKIVKTRSIPNVDDARLLDSLQQTHAMIHTADGLHQFDGTRRSLTDIGRRGLKIRAELRRRGVESTGIPCRWCA